MNPFEEFKSQADYIGKANAAGHRGMLQVFDFSEARIISAEVEAACEKSSIQEIDRRKVIFYVVLLFLKSS